MTYDTQRAKYSREHIYIVEIDLDFCGNTFGSTPCTATGTGDAKCFNTFSNCQDTANFTTTTKTYRFCQARSPHPIGINAIPNLKTVNITPSKIDVAGGMGERSSVSLLFSDHPHSDIDIDPYLSGRTWIASDRATFWTKLRARNPNYQFRDLRLKTGYIENGEYKAENFKTRNYVIDKMSVSNGTCSITAKDPLKKASSKKAQVPAPNTGTLLSDITSGATSATLAPAGIGNAEYAASGSIVIGSEICTFTRSGDTLTLTRAQNNTAASSHTAGDIVQECYVQAAEVNTIVEDLLTNYADIDASYINSDAWQFEVDEHLNGNLNGVIPKPTDVEKVLKELAEAKPHFIYWDEINQQINFTALKTPLDDYNTLNMDEHFIKNSVRVSDKPEMRASTIYVTFGQIDPTKALNDTSNYTQTYVRVDTDSIAKYGSNVVKTVVSRWIDSGNKTAAINLAESLGRRFSNIPREIEFKLDAKDSDLLLGQTIDINHRDIVDEHGLNIDTAFQIISAQEALEYKYKGIEYQYGDQVAGDLGTASNNIIISPNQRNVNLYDKYFDRFGAPTASTDAVFYVEYGTTIGSATTSTQAIVTGTWPAGSTITLVNYGFIVGRGGEGAGTAAADGQPGGDAISMAHDMTIKNFGVIGGGGGGGQKAVFTSGSRTVTVAGGGGAGNIFGYKGTSFHFYSRNFGEEDGTRETGGAGGDYLGYTAGRGGYLGEDGQSSSGAASGTVGAAGKAVDKNGYTLTESPAFTSFGVRGAVS